MSYAAIKTEISLTRTLSEPSLYCRLKTGFGPYSRTNLCVIVQTRVSVLNTDEKGWNPLISKYRQARLKIRSAAEFF